MRVVMIGGEARLNGGDIDALACFFARLRASVVREAGDGVAIEQVAAVALLVVRRLCVARGRARRRRRRQLCKLTLMFVQL